MKSVFGRYLPGNSLLYRMDPRLKVVITLLYIIFVFLAHYFIDLLIIIVPLWIGYIITTKRVLPLIKLIKFPLFISLVILLVNIYSLKYGENLNPNAAFGYDKIITEFPEFRLIIWPKYGYALTYEAINKAIALFFRIYTMILITTLLTNTTKPILLTKALEDLMFPLKLLFVPVHIVAMIISIALRFIPTLLDEANRIMKAQSSRGVDFKNGKMKEKIIAFTTLIIPLFVSSFAKAEDLSYAMETRGYDPYAKRSKYRKLTFGLKDVIISLFILLLITFLIINIYNVNSYLPSWYIKTLVV
ncbi:energy-coupling factor transporter transmembrane component T family protein [Mycoplasma crocodyli]|uniref:Cobalt ABC transporter, permease protein n=1 Tax=Mycoplasma crocodyli (strain ATCC 51981 / MP145) TaxID=512564 RepID=D5E690_MYCCM|nr:energy-coupling factor transporter transmembrane component T [Mycoplasma crocodyli]ADE19864.1 cobalt ABC transporter, permease protein [Mycoplasma crocodyli MP145]